MIETKIKYQSRLVLLGLLILTTVFLAAPAHADEGHDHGIALEEPATPVPGQESTTTAPTDTTDTRPETPAADENKTTDSMNMDESEAQADDGAKAVDGGGEKAEPAEHGNESYVVNDTSQSGFPVAIGLTLAVLIIFALAVVFL